MKILPSLPARWKAMDSADGKTTGHLCLQQIRARNTISCSAHSRHSHQKSATGDKLEHTGPFLQPRGASPLCKDTRHAIGIGGNLPGAWKHQDLSGLGLSRGVSIYSRMEKSTRSSLLLTRPLFNPCNLSGSEAEFPIQQGAAQTCGKLLAAITRALPAAAPSPAMFVPPWHSAGRQEHFHTALESPLTAHHGWLGKGSLAGRETPQMGKRM